ncbi:MAG TPA: sigma-70 family RNA polymerase sigma factor [Steroidobacteraceae bacterium]|nr:sigma-70 family RNA polymerase sigma factor [Steroidobacteraceae bacterium]
MSDPTPPRELTQLLAAWGRGDHQALEQLTALVYGELRRLAHHHMGGQAPGHMLQTTALVNEAYMRLASQEKPDFNNRAHFLAVAAKAMRQILVDHAKASHRKKRGSGAGAVELEEAALVLPEPTREIVDLNEALEKLAQLDARKAQVVELKYFGGLEYDEIASHLNVSIVTVQRDWTFSKAWLHSELQSSGV